MWMTFSELPNWNDIEPPLQFLLDKGVPTDDKVFWQKSTEKYFMEGHLSVEELMSVLAHQKWTRYFENKKNGWCHSELFKMS
jgi:hypothetical protein